MKLSIKTSTGEILRQHTFPIPENALIFELKLTEYGFVVLLEYNEKIPKDNNPEYYDWVSYSKIQFFSYTEGLQWEKAFCFPTGKVIPLMPKKQTFYFSNDYNGGDIKCPVLIDCNSTHCMIGLNCTYCENHQQFYLFMYTHDGDLEWTYSTPISPEVSVLHLACNEKAIYMAGYTDTEFLPTNESSYQKSIAGETDVFLQALSLEKETLWSTYLGGSNKEPYDILNNSYMLCSSMKFSMQDNLLCVTFPTISNNIPLFKNIPAHEGKSVQKVPFANSLLAILNDHGVMQQCTYTYAEGPNDKQPSPKDDPPEFKRDMIGDYVQDVKIHKNDLYIVSTGNSPITLLTNPNQKFVTTSRTGEYSNYFFFLSKYSINAGSKE